MYDASDPRASLATAPKGPEQVVSAFAAAEYAKFYEAPPQDNDANGQTWFARGQNFIIAFSEAKPGATFIRHGQPDEYVALVPNPETPVEFAAPSGNVTIDGRSLAFLPPGETTIRLPRGGRIIRMFTTRNKDLADRCVNAAAYAAHHPNIPEFQPWPDPPGGFKVRTYSLNVAAEPGRFGRIWRCTTFMVNYLDYVPGPRDIRKMSPHHHDDFEQCSLALEGAYIHHIRWPWSVDKRLWRDDDHEYCAAPSIAVIPPPATHTSQAMNWSGNQLVDIFSPPRFDFSAKPGWVLNADEYPVP